MVTRNTSIAALAMAAAMSMAAVAPSTAQARPAGKIAAMPGTSGATDFSAQRRHYYRGGGGGAAAAAAFAGIVGTGLAIAASQNRGYGYYDGGPAYYGGGPAYYGGAPYEAYGSYGGPVYGGGYAPHESDIGGQPNPNW